MVLGSKISCQRACEGILCLSLVVFLGPGCGLVLDLSPPEGAQMRCVAVLQNGDMEVSISSELAEFGSIDFWHCNNNCGSCGRRTFDEARADWIGWIPVRLAEVQATMPESIFSMHPGPWCLVAESARCFDNGPLVSGRSCTTSGTPLASCPPLPPPVAQCLNVDCATRPCETIDFGSLRVGGTDSRVLNLNNCGDDAVRVQIDDSLVSFGGLADFSVPDATNGCLPRTAEERAAGRLLQSAGVDPAEAQCDVVINFEPRNPGAHQALKRFSSSVNPGHEIQLRGVGVPGSVSSDAPDLLCFDALAGACTRTRIVRISNGGPGDVTITDIRVERAPANFEIVSPPPPPLPIVLAAGAPPLEVRVRWCDVPPGASDGVLVIDTNDPANPSIFVNLIRQPTPCP